MRKLLHEFIHEIKNLNKIRTLSLLGFLILVITVPVVTGQFQKDKAFQTKAYAQPTGGTVAFMLFGKAYVGDSFAPGWTTKTWYGAGNTAIQTVTDPVYDGTHALSYKSTAPNDTMELYTTTPIDISKYTYLTFYARGGMQGLRYQVTLLGPLDAKGNHKPIGTYLPMDQYGGVPPTDQWFVYGFPLATFNAGTTQVYGVAFTDSNGGGTQAPLYLDEIAFSAARAPDTTPTVPIGPPATKGPSPTRVPDYYPDISPWVFIIPAIIIFLAIFFE